MNGSTRRGWWLGVSALALMTIPLRAADFWEKKEPSEWSQEEVQKMLSDCPWAKRSLVTPSTPYGSVPSEERDNCTRYTLRLLGAYIVRERIREG